MDKQPNIEILLAMSQLIHAPSNKRVYGLPINRIMPFISLHKSLHGLIQGGYSQTSQTSDLAEMPWGDARITHVSNESNQYTHNHYINQNKNDVVAQRKNTGKNTSQQSFSHVYKKSEVNNSEASITSNNVSNVLLQSAVDNKGKAEDKINIVQRKFINNTESMIKKENSTTKIDKNTQFTNTGFSKRFSSRQVESDLSNELTEQSIINRSMTYRPFFIRGDKHNKNNTNRNINDVRQLIPQLTGLLNRKNNNRHLARRNKVIPIDNHSMGYDVNYTIEAIEGESSSSARMQVKPSINLPNKNHQKHLLNDGADPSLNISKSLSETIEKIVEKKVQNESRTKAPVSDSAYVIKDELREILKPEKLITDEVVRILLKKIQQSIREERFRMGLLS